jgi:hypothetical protein
MIGIGKGIYAILTGDTTVYGLVSTNIFPLITPEKVNLPCIIYERQSDPDNTKDGVGMYECLVYLTIISKDYANTITIAEACNGALNEYSGVMSGITFLKIRLTSVFETYAEDVFMQRLTYSVKCR